VKYGTLDAIISERFGREATACAHCGAMLDDPGDVCPECGRLQDLEDVDENEEMMHEIDIDELDQATPPGEEKLVKKLKKQPGVDNPWALAWSIHNKKKKKR